MNRRHSALAVAALLGITGLGASYGATAAGSAVSATPDTTEVTDTTEPSETTEESDTTDSTDTTEATTEASDTTEGGPESTFPDWEPEPIEWTEGVVPGTEEGYLEVPIDYADPDGGTLRIFVTRHPAAVPADRVGSLLVNPGGPGFGGSEFGTYADQIYNQDLLDSFDIIGFDPRGTGISEPAIDCVDDYDHFYAGTDITPDDAEETQEIIDLAEEYATACAEKNAEIIQFVGTNNSARDMDSIRRALDEDTISYFGFSYGSELGATWATLFPDTVRAAVLDGASDPNADALEGSLQQVQGFEGTLETFLAACSANTLPPDDAPCAFNSDGDAEGAFDQLMLKLDDKPIPSIPGRPDVTRGVALQAVAEAMYSDTSWPDLSQALADAQQGDGAGLLALYDSYYQYNGDGTWQDPLEAFQTIVCMDTEERLTVEEDDATAPQFNEVAPRFAPGTTGSYFCTFFPESTDPRADIDGAGAGPIVVCGATGDAATPLASTRNMAAALEDGRLVVIEADQHTCYGATECADAIIDNYLVNLEVPAKETNCPGDEAPDSTSGDDATESTEGAGTSETTEG